MCIRSRVDALMVTDTIGGIGGLVDHRWTKNVVCKRIKAAVTHHSVHAFEFTDALCNARFNEAIPFIYDLVDIETGRHERGNEEPLEAGGEHGGIDIGGTGEMGEREAEGIIRINARVCVILKEGSLWQVRGGDVGQGRCGSLFVLGRTFSGGTLGRGDGGGGGKGRRHDTLL